MGLPKIKFIIASNGLELLTADIQKTPGLVQALLLQVKLR